MLYLHLILGYGIPAGHEDDIYLTTDAAYEAGAHSILTPPGAIAEANLTATAQTIVKRRGRS